MILIFAAHFTKKSYEMTLHLIEGHTVPYLTHSPELASSSLTESWGVVRLALATNGAGRWVVWSDDTKDTACLLESLPHRHLVGTNTNCISQHMQLMRSQACLALHRTNIMDSFSCHATSFVV